jgi:hypothetical protein
MAGDYAGCGLLSRPQLGKTPLKACGNSISILDGGEVPVDCSMEAFNSPATTVSRLEKLQVVPTSKLIR